MRFNRVGLIQCLMFLLPSVLAGCSELGFRPARQPAPAMETHLYGRLDSWQAVNFEAKPFSSLLQHTFCEEGGDFDPDVSRDGKWLVVSSLRHSPNPDIYVKRTNGLTATRLTSDPASEIQPAFSPLGDKVAYASNRSGNWDIWVIGVDGTNATRMTTSAANEIHPSWSPDGKQLVYCCLGARSQQWELWIVDVEQPSIKKWIGYGLFPEWCPNPEIPKIAFQLARHRGSQWFSVWTVDMIEGEARFPTEIVSSVEHACICPSWSPQGRELVYSTVARSRYEDKVPAEVPGASGEDVYVTSLDGRENLRLTQGQASNFSPTWSPDGRIFFCSDRTGIENVWSVMPRPVDFQATAPIDLSQHPQSAIIAN